MRHHHPPLTRAARGAATVAVVLATALSGCGADLAAPPALPPDGSTALPLHPRTPPVVPVVPSTISVSSTTAASTTLVPAVSGGAGTVPVSLLPGSPIDSTTVLSAEGPWTRVDAAPGIATAGLFYELLPQVWVYLPTAEDVPNGILWTLRDDSRPIVEGYLRAQAARLRPGANVVLRPQVLGDDRTDTTALVADCVLSVGTTSPPAGLGAALTSQSGEWVVAEQGPREDACWFA